MSVQKVVFWSASFIEGKQIGARLDVSGCQILFERLRDSAFMFRWYPCTLLSLSIQAARTALVGVKGNPFQFSFWLQGFDRFDLSFCPSKMGYGWHRLLDVCQPSMFWNKVYFCFRKAFFEPFSETEVTSIVLPGGLLGD